MWPNSQKTVDLVTFTKEILNGKLHVCAVISPNFVPQLNLDLNLSEFCFHIVKIYLKLSEYYPNFYWITANPSYIQSFSFNPLNASVALI